MLNALLLTEEDCTTSEDVLESLRAAQEEFPDLLIRQRVLDEEPELVTSLGVVASPALIINDQLAFQGHPGDDQLRVYLRNELAGLHANPDAYPPDNERDPENRGQEATGSADPAYRGSGRH